ncbi:hypothetical protein [Desulfarculus baarsii]
MSENQTETKPWYQSKTIWGGVVSFIAVVGGLFGLNMNADEQTAVTEGLMAVGGLIGVGMTIWGRLSASKGIGKAPTEGQ